MRCGGSGSRRSWPSASSSIGGPDLDRALPGNPQRAPGCCSGAVAVNLGVLGFSGVLPASARRLRSPCLCSGSPAARRHPADCDLIPTRSNRSPSNVDVHRGDVKARTNLIDFGLFLSFFPHLVAGPIIRPAHFFPQLVGRPVPSGEDISWGCSLADRQRSYQEECLRRQFRRDRKSLFQRRRHPRRRLDRVDRDARLLDANLLRLFGLTPDIARGCARLLRLRSFHPTSSGLLSPGTLRNSGDAGTYRCRRGSATIYTFPSAAIAKAKSAPTST